MSESKQPRRIKTSTLVILFVLVAYFTYHMATYESSSANTTTRANAFDAWITCQLAVKDALVAPLSAKFGRYEAHPENEDGDTDYWFRSYVDAQNSFGANVRTRFNCRVQYVGDNDYRVERLTFD